MSTNEEKARLAKLLQDLEVAEERLPERCQPLLKEMQEKFAGELIEEQGSDESEEYVNPYIPDRGLLEENDRKLQDLLAEEKSCRITKVQSEELFNTADPKRPWRTNSNKEKLLRIESELKRLKSPLLQKTSPLAEGDASKANCQDDAKTFAPTGLQ